MHAKRAQELQIKIRRPSTKDYLQILNTNALLNCPMTTRDVWAAEDIFGQDIGSLKGKTTDIRHQWLKPQCQPYPEQSLDNITRSCYVLT